MFGCSGQGVSTDAGPDAFVRTVRCCGSLGMWTGQPSGTDYICRCSANDSCADAERSCTSLPRDASRRDGAMSVDADIAMSFDAGADAAEDAP
jgi:hypothetical protein